MTDPVYINLWNKFNENFMTAPKDSEGNPQPSFLKFLALVYSTEEAELLRHMKRPGQFITTEELASITAKPLEYIEKTMDGIHIIGDGKYFDTS